MRNVTKITFFASLLLLATGAWADTPPALESILNSDEFSVEQLVDFGAQSEQSAAQVMEATARRYPRLLQETVLGLALRLDEKPFYAAFDVAMNNLSDDPALQELLVASTRRSERIAFRDTSDGCLAINNSAADVTDKNRFSGWSGANNAPRSLPRGIAACNNAERVGADADLEVDVEVPGPIIPDPPASPS